MRISQIRATPVNVRFREPERWSQGQRAGVTAIVVEVETDGGITGLGESVPAPTPEVTLTAINSVTPLLLGSDPRQVAQRWQAMQGIGGWSAFPHTGNAALSGIEIACWDLLGKSLGAPVHALFGGCVRDRVEFMGFVPWHPDPARIETEARAQAAAGYRTLYVKGGFGERRDLISVAALRRGAGAEAKLRIDPNEAWSGDVALRMAQALREFDLQYIEQPTRMDRLEELALLRRRSPVPIAANQSSWLNHNVLDIVSLRAADVIMTDPWQAGGLSAFLAAARLCETAGVPLVYHSFAPLSIATRAAMQVLAVSAACHYAHQTYHGMLVGDVVRYPVRHQAGHEPVDDRPGIGAELDPETFRAAHAAFCRDGYLSAYAAPPDADRRRLPPPPGLRAERAAAAGRRSPIHRPRSAIPPAPCRADR
jgi:L-alanine-DL-glutamate epimerase-like enolase superfamily enzyme